MKNKLRIGILLDDYLVPSWAFKMIDEINQSNHSEIVLVIKNDKSIIKESLFKRLWKSRTNFFYLFYMKLERKITKIFPDAFELKNLRSIINCPEIKVIPKKTYFSDRISDDEIEKIKLYKTDVLIRLGFRILRGKILNISKYGVWSYHHGDNNTNRGGPAGVWEVLEKNHETGVVLQILNEDLDGGFKLYESFSATDKENITRNTNNFYWKSASILPKCLSDLYFQGEETFFDSKRVLNPEVYFYSHKLYTSPSNFIFLKKIFVIYFKAILRKLSNIFYFNQWILLFHFGKNEQFKKSFYRFKRILPPKDRFWADPFVFIRNEKYYVFFEEYIFKKAKGTISVIELNKSGEYTPSTIVLEKDYHLSYPFLFEDNDELFMIPETATNKTIELYKCEEFPLKWTLEKVLINNIHAVDSTILKHNDKFWLFCNVMKNQGSNTKDELSLFYSENLNSNKWISHPNNPIISDVKTARPAGKIFKFNNKIYRPSQNNSKTYGYGMQIREILKLDENSYVESHVHSIYPNWANDIYATHTINQENELTIIDALVRRKKF